MNYSELFETIKGYCENDFPDTSFTDSGGNTINGNPYEAFKALTGAPITYLKHKDN